MNIKNSPRVISEDFEYVILQNILHLMVSNLSWYHSFLYIKIFTNRPKLFINSTEEDGTFSLKLPFGSGNAGGYVRKWARTIRDCLLQTN